MSTILVVDDDPTFGRLMDTVFELEGHQAVIVSRVKDIVPRVRQVQPHLVVMDVNVAEGQNTLGALQQLKAGEDTRDIPVVMTSGMDHAAECLAAGAARFILKPFRPSELLDLVEQWL